MTKLDRNQPKDRTANNRDPQRRGWPFIMNTIHFLVRQPLTRTKMNYIHYKTSDDPESRIPSNWEEAAA
jgi:hypothetical protein